MIHYHVGYNMPGYMPDMEPWTTDSFEEARDFLLDELGRHLDDDYVMNDGMQLRDREGRFVPYERAALIKDLKACKTPGNWGDSTSDLAYWIMECARVGPDHVGDE